MHQPIAPPHAPHPAPLPPPVPAPAPSPEMLNALGELDALFRHQQVKLHWTAQSCKRCCNGCCQVAQAVKVTWPRPNSASLLGVHF